MPSLVFILALEFIMYEVCALANIISEVVTWQGVIVFEIYNA